MCQSKADGGQRCYSHTRAAMERVLSNPDPRDPSWHSAVDEAMTEHATTDRGRREIAALATPGDEWSTLRVQTYLAAADRRRQERREINEQVARHVADRASITPQAKAAWSISLGDRIVRDAQWNSFATSNDRTEFVNHPSRQASIEDVIDDEGGEVKVIYREVMNRRERSAFRTQVLDTFWARANGY